MNLDQDLQLLYQVDPEVWRPQQLPVSQRGIYGVESDALLQLVVHIRDYHRYPGPHTVKSHLEREREKGHG